MYNKTIRVPQLITAILFRDIIWHKAYCNDLLPKKLFHNKMICKLLQLQWFYNCKKKQNVNFLLSHTVLQATMT